jgi:hypothetical protein
LVRTVGSHLQCTRFLGTRRRAAPFICFLSSRRRVPQHAFVLGAFGKNSNSCCSLFTAIERSDAARVVTFWKTPPKRALALCKEKILRFRGLTAQRGWARFILGCFHDLVPPPGDRTAATREPGSNSNSSKNKPKRQKSRCCGQKCTRMRYARVRT